jgi:hypothetical protein
MQALGGARYTNIQFFNFLERELFNDLLNATDIDLSGLSGGESWNLIPFNTTCLGKWAIVLNCSGQKTWANKDNSILVNPNGKTEATDGVHFVKGMPFSQGNIYTFSNEDVLSAMELAANKYVKKPNVEGEKLKEIFSYDKTVDYILNKLT